MRFFIILSFIFLLVALVAFPEVDLAVSSLFFTEESGFYLGQNPILIGFKQVAYHGARLMAVFFLIAALVAFFRKSKWFCLVSKDWVFLFCCLLIGPGLLANVVFKDHWGRARPRDIVVFNGEASFTPAAYLADQCDRNCSFVSGDASFGFFLTSFAFVVAPHRRRRVFCSALGVGSLFAGARILMGAHFLSDVMFALALIFAVNMALAFVFYGRSVCLGIRPLRL